MFRMQPPAPSTARLQLSLCRQLLQSLDDVPGLIVQCRRFVLLLTSGTFESHWTMNEVSPCL